LVRLMLGSGCAFGCGFLAIALVEAIDASRGIDQLLLAGKERVASGTNFDVQVTFLGGASFERLATRASNGNFVIFGMNSWFHVSTLYGRHKGRVFKHIIIDYLPQRRKAHAKTQNQDLCVFLCSFAPLRENFFVFLSQNTPSTYP